jgi:hypothetical protein
LDNYYFFGQQSGLWRDIIVPVTSLLVSVTAIFISLLVARRQHQIQEQQLKKDLFDRRYKVYTGTREFANYVRSGPDAMEMTHPHFGLFVDLIERAEMLFGSAVC